MHVSVIKKAGSINNIQPVFISFVFDCLFFMAYIMGRIFLRIHFKHFDFIEWFDLNSNSSNLFQTSSASDFLVDFLMLLCILFIFLEIFKFSSSRLILINTQSIFFSSAFCL